MTKTEPRKPRILFLFSDTGGGHRSAAEAIIEAINNNYGDRVLVEMVDFFKEHAPPPLDRVPEFYPQMVRVPQAWGWGYRISNGHRRSRLITGSLWPYVQFSARDLVRKHPSDLIVSVHPLVTAPVLKALGKNHPPFITVVTDLVTTHALWYHRRVSLCLVPTEAAETRALQFGLRPEQVKVVGLPVAEQFCQPTGDREILRGKLGWPQDLPVVILVGGGDGMGPIKKTAQAIANLGLRLSLVIITGRNQDLKKSLEEIQWPMPTFIYGFVREMPDYMRAADILVTKAGPGTISEALNAGLPMILYSRLPGQEDGNVAFVVSEGAGVWAPRAELIASALSNWINHPEKREKAAAKSRTLAYPQAAQTIAQITAEHVGIRNPSLT